VGTRIELDGGLLCAGPFDGLTSGLWTIWCVDPESVPCGEHTLTGICDPNNTIAESNAINNEKDTVWTCCPAGISLASAASRRVHGGVDRDLPVDISIQTLEPRVVTAGSPAVVLNFSDSPGALNCTNIVPTNATCSSVSVSGSTAVVSLGGLTVNQCVRLQLTGIPDFQGDADVHVLHHTGDVTGDGAVNLLDLQLIKTDLFQSVGPGKFTPDVNADNSINLLDLQAIKLNLFQPVGICP
jgi:hypothetical protein